MGLSQRADTLEQIQRLITRIATQIRYTAAPLRDILSPLAVEGEYKALLFLQDIQHELDHDKTLSSVWNQSVRNRQKVCGLNRADTELLVEFGNGLGKTDIEGQLSHCELYAELFSRQAENARQEVAAKGRLYTTLGIAGGLALALLLI